MTFPLLALFAGLALLVWSADRFVDGAAATASHLGMSPLLIGMVVVGFGTSAPEMAVSALAALQGNPGIALGNAYGSNIANIALILGVTAMIHPVALHSRVLRAELPILAGSALLGCGLLLDGTLSRGDGWVLLTVFFAIMTWTVFEGMRKRGDALAGDMSRELDANIMPLGRALFWLIAGTVLLVGASRILVWGAVEVATWFGVSDLIIGLTVVAVGTSLPELASSLAAARKGEHDIALGNVIGSNLFNTLAVVGIAGAIQPLSVGPEVLSRDGLVMLLLTGALFVFGYGFRGPGWITRLEVGLLLAVYFGYNGYLVLRVILPEGG